MLLHRKVAARSYIPMLYFLGLSLIRNNLATSITSQVKFVECLDDDLGHVTLLGDDMNLLKCAAYCADRKWCKALAFRRSMSMCSLYLDMSAWDGRISRVGNCAIIRKEDLQGASFEGIKLKELGECPPFGEVPHGKVLGNMNTEGVRKQVVCDAGFEIDFHTDITQCFNGSWTPTPKCVKACHPGYQRHGGPCYRYLGPNYNYSEALIQCDRRRSQILSMDSDDDRAYIASLTGSYYIWIRIDQSDVEWKKHVIGKDVNHSWCPDEPSGDDQTCLALYTQKSESCYHDAFCDNEKLHTVCKQPLA